MNADEKRNGPRDLSPTAHVILGMLRRGPRSGYEIKQAVDHSTRFFWAASYGQIYPELRKLADAGLVAGEDKPQGGRKRKIYRLTEAGREALVDWLAADPAVLELRDEGLLKLFFAAAAEPPERAVEILDAKRRLNERQLERLREIEPLAAAHAEGDPYPYLVLRHGIELYEWTIEWCKRARAELEQGGNRRGGGGRSTGADRDAG